MVSGKAGDGVVWLYTFASSQGRGKRKRERAREETYVLLNRMQMGERTSKRQSYSVGLEPWNDERRRYESCCGRLHRGCSVAPLRVLELSVRACEGAQGLCTSTMSMLEGLDAFRVSPSR
jgi:hypothetical protein